MEYTKIALIFLLIVGTIAAALAMIDDLEERNLAEDMSMLDADGQSEVESFCNDVAHADDPVCQAIGK